MQKNFYSTALQTLFLIGIVYLLSIGHSRAEQETGRADTSHDESTEFFRDKVVGVMLKGANSDQSNSWFTEVRLVNIEGRKFLVGKMYLPKTKEYEKYSGFRDAVHGYAWEEISRFKTMTVEEFELYVKEWKKSSDDASESNIEKY